MAVAQAMTEPAFTLARFHTLPELGVRMPSRERYREMAAECVRIAQQSTNPEDKALLLEMADLWRRMAERAETPDGPKRK